MAARVRKAAVTAVLLLLLTPALAAGQNDPNAPRITPTDPNAPQQSWRSNGGYAEAGRIAGKMCSLFPALGNRGPRTEAECEQEAYRCDIAQHPMTDCRRIVEWCTQVWECRVVLPDFSSGTFSFTTDWAKWLTSYPNYSHPSSPQPAWDIARYTQAAGLALLALFLTFGVMHSWASGMLNIGNGGIELLAAPMRAVGAFVAILVWPHAMSQLESICEEIIDQLLGHDAENIGGALIALNRLRDATDAFAPLIPGPDWLPGVSDIIALLLKFAVALTMLGLSGSKLALDISSHLLLYAIPLAFAMWVLPLTSWLASAMARASVAITFVPVGWAFTLAAFASFSGEFYDDNVPGALATSLIDPLVGIVVLLMLFAVMRQILHWGNVVPNGARPLAAAWGAAMGAGIMALQVGSMAMQLLRGARWGGFGGAGGGGAGGGGGGGPMPVPQQQPRPTPGTAVERRPRTAPDGPMWRDRGGGGDGPVHAEATRLDWEQASQPPSQPPPGLPDGNPPAELGPARRERDWSRPYKSDERLDGTPVSLHKRDGTPSKDAEPTNMEFQASRHRVTENGPPSTIDMNGARRSLSFDQQRWLGSIAQDERPEFRLARAASLPDLDPAHRDAFRTLLDGAHHSASRDMFVTVASQPPTQRGDAS